MIAKIKKHQLIEFLISIMLLLSFAVIASAGNSSSIKYLPVDTSRFLVSQEYTPHSEISISSNSEFTTEGFIGNGTQEYPYTINFLEIASMSNCIDISNTNAYFVINGCYLTSPTGRNGIGVNLNNVSNGRIELSTIVMKYTGIRAYNSSYCIVADSIIQNGNRAGVFLDNSTQWDMNNLTVSGSVGDGFYIGNSNHINIQTSKAQNNGWNGFNLYTSRYCTVINSQSKSNTQCGILISYTKDCQFVADKAEQNVGIGIQIRYESDRISITNSSVQSNKGNGVHIEFSSDFTEIHQSDISNNVANGVYIDGSFGCIISGNSIYDNGAKGIQLDSSSWGNHVYENEIGWNREEDADDNGLGNIWDAGLDKGNYWSAVALDSVYVIDGASESIDRYPKPLLFIEHINNISCDIGSANCSIHWHAFALHPSSYRIYLDGEEVESQHWDGNDITFQVHQPLRGSYYYSIEIVDTRNHSRIGPTTLTIDDFTMPQIQSTADIEYLQGITGNRIIWYAFDATPTSYKISRNSILLRSGSWDGSPIEINVDNLAPGTYSYQLIVTDIAGNSAMDTVVVRVNPNGACTNDLLFSPVIGGALFLCGSIFLSLSILSTKYDISKFFKKKAKTPEVPPSE